MSDKDIRELKAFRGATYRIDNYLRDEMSEYAIFDKGEEDEPVFHRVLNGLREIESDISILIKKYDE